MGWPARNQRRHPVSGVPYALLRERARATRLETGASLDAIAAELGVTTAAVSKWVSDLPEHAAIVEANHQARAERRRLYPVGTRPYVTKLIRAGIAPAERIRLAQETAR